MGSHVSRALKILLVSWLRTTAPVATIAAVSAAERSVQGLQARIPKSTALDSSDASRPPSGPTRITTSSYVLAFPQGCPDGASLRPSWKAAAASGHFPRFSKNCSPRAVGRRLAPFPSRIALKPRRRWSLPSLFLFQRPPAGASVKRGTKTETPNSVPCRRISCMGPGRRHANARVILSSSALPEQRQNRRSSRIRLLGPRSSA